MKKMKIVKITGLMVTALLTASMIIGCSTKGEEEKAEEDIASENVVITETGEVFEREEVSAVTEASPEATTEPEVTTPEVITPDMSLLAEPEQEQVITQEDQTEPQGNQLQLVFLGDSIFDTNRDGTGIPYRTAVQCEADVYNLAIGGTCAAVASDGHLELEKWSSRSLVGMVNAITKRIPTDIFENDAAKTILDNPDIDFSKTDYFIIEYGMNDFLSAVPLDSEQEIYDLKTYAGALQYATVNLQDVAPNAVIILCAPNYAQFYNGTWMIGDGNSINNGYGTLFDYKGICQYVANTQQTLFFNAYEDIGINGYTADEYLEDGIHLTDSGRQLYADALARMILKYEETRNN